jgi:signal transduction histidine kinase
MKNGSLLAAVRITESYLRRAQDIAETEICRRSITRIPIYLFLYLAVVAVTPLPRRFPILSIAFGLLLLILSAFRLFIAIKLPKSSGKKLKKLMPLGIYLMATVWGLFSSLTIQYFELGWVSFFVLLATVGIAAGEMSALSPSFAILSSFMVLILGPTVIASFVLVKGLSGTAIGVFFLGYLVFLILQGREESREYWERLRENSQLVAMIDAVPGTLSWVTSDLIYKGVNRRMAQLWNGEPASFVGKQVGFLDPSSSTIDFTRNLFQSQSEAMSAEAQLTMQGRLRVFFLFGQKYNLGTEAIVLGLDVTEMRESEKMVLIERAQRFYSARLANLGQVSHILYSGIKNHIHALLASIEGKTPGEIVDSLKGLNGLLEIVQDISKAESLDKKGFSNVPSLLNRIFQLFESFAKLQGVKFKLQLVPGLENRKVPIPEGHLGSIVISLLSNSFDAVSEGGAKEVSVETKVDTLGQMLSIDILDGGKGIPEELQARLFEPLFTTKSPDHATGTGLSVSKEMVESYGGHLEYDGSGEQTRFRITLPLINN